jgi:cytochrome c-type biogenesis protein CcmH
MTSFFSVCVILVAFAVSFVLLPFLYRSRLQKSYEVESQAIQERANVRIYKERMRELQEDFRQGRVEKNQLERLQEELAAKLLQDTEVAEASVRAKFGIGLGAGLLSVAIALLLIGSYVLYERWGAMEGVLARDVLIASYSSIDETQTAAEQGDTRALLEQLYSRLKLNPDNKEGWSLLANSAMNTGYYRLAAEAYRNLIRLEENAAFYGLKAQAEFFDGKSIKDPAVASALASALALNENESNALTLIAIDHFQQSRFAEALNIWQGIIDADPNYPGRSAIEQGMQEARARIGIQANFKAEQAVKPAPNPLTNNAELTNAARIDLTVEVSPELAATYTPDTPVFIFARDPEGLPMPLAAVRLVLADLPATLSLTDASAMSPIAQLSMAERVTVTARIAASGQPIATSGDAQASKESVPIVGADPLILRISEKIP